MKSKRVERFLRHIEDNKMNEVCVLSNTGIGSNCLIKKLKEYTDIKFINMNDIKSVDGFNCKCLVLGYRWYININNIQRGLILTTNPNNTFEINLDDF